MYKSKEENVEIYFICFKKEDMDLVESYYDEVLNLHCWYFNCYLAYQSWQNNFKKLKKIGKLTKKILIVAASRYLIYKVENNEFENEKEKERVLKDLEKINKQLEIIIKDENILTKL